ncbi:hypothetical protein ABQE44_04080 [Mycolicibacterium sp. XJ2546]
MTVIPGGFRAPTARENKVGAQDVHRWIQSGRFNYPTKYEFDGGTREQFKLIVGEYCRMETEKTTGSTARCWTAWPGCARSAGSISSR